VDTTLDWKRDAPPEKNQHEIVFDHTVMFNDKIIAEIEKWKPSSSFSYGTAGFRARANLLPPVVFRCGKRTRVVG